MPAPSENEVVSTLNMAECVCVCVCVYVCVYVGSCQLPPRGEPGNTHRLCVAKADNHPCESCGVVQTTCCGNRHRSCESMLNNSTREMAGVASTGTAVPSQNQISRQQESTKTGTLWLKTEENGGPCAEMESLLWWSNTIEAGPQGLHPQATPASLVCVGDPFEGRGTSQDTVDSAEVLKQLTSSGPHAIYPGHFVTKDSVIITRWTASRFKVCVCVGVCL